MHECPHPPERSDRAPHRLGGGLPVEPEIPDHPEDLAKVRRQTLDRRVKLLPTLDRDSLFGAVGSLGFINPAGPYR